MIPYPVGILISLCLQEKSSLVGRDRLSRRCTHFLIEQGTSCFLRTATIVAPEVLFKGAYYVYEDVCDEATRLRLFLQQKHYCTQRHLRGNSRLAYRLALT